MSKFIDRIGEKFITKQGYEVEIVEYFNNVNCTIRFNTSEKIVLKKQSYKRIKSGNIKNPYCPIFHSIGYVGEGGFKATTHKKINSFYNIWRNMLSRCYSKKEQLRFPTYKICSVVEEWHNFQNFAQWFYENYNHKVMEGWHLDKDILIKGNKIYSPETCCFVPNEINGLFVKSNSVRGLYPIGVNKKGNKYQSNVSKNSIFEYLGTFDTPEEAFQAYKIVKEDWIKEVADEWRGQITEQTYQALINYKVEITD